MTNTGIVDLFANNINIVLGGVRIGRIGIPSDYVPYTFAPILGTHELLSGDQLENGMIVVLEDSVVRANPNSLSPENPDRARGYVPSEYERRRVETTSRWSLVTDLKVRDRMSDDGPLVSFTAIYADGTMRHRTYSSSYKWAALKEFEKLPVCPEHGVVHEVGGDILDMEALSRQVTGRVFGEEMSFDDFTERLHSDPEDVMNKIFGSDLGSTFGILFGEPKDTTDAETPADGPQRPGQTEGEYEEDLLTRLRTHLRGE